MSILFVLLTFLIIISISYFLRREQPAEAVAAGEVLAAPSPPEMVRELGFEVPKGYCFHPGHTWVLDEGRQNARMGIDSFATSVFGKIDRIEVTGLNRWVRQGQKICTVAHDGVSADFMSPVEGVVSSVNHEVLRDPNLIVKDPYRNGWICVVKAPEVGTNIKNLLQGTMVGTWLHNSFRRLQAYAGELGAATADGGLAVSGLLGHADPETRRAMLREFFLN